MRTLTEEERRKIRMDIQWLVESIKPASAGGGYSSKSVGEAMDRIIAIIDRLTAPEPQSFEIGPDKTSSIEPKAVFGDATGNSIASVQGQDRSKPTPAAEPDREISNPRMHARKTDRVEIDGPSGFVHQRRARTQPAGVDKEALYQAVANHFEPPRTWEWNEVVDFILAALPQMGKSGPSHEAIRNAIWRNKHDFNAVAEQVLALIGRG